jgi:hypothetical protein
VGNATTGAAGCVTGFAALAALRVCDVLFIEEDTTWIFCKGREESITF